MATTTGPQDQATHEPEERDDAQVDVAALTDRLKGRWAGLRDKARSLAADPRLVRTEGQTVDEHRQDIFAKLKILVDEGEVNRAFPKFLGGGDDPGGNIAGFEELLIADPSLQIKSGVQWGLFGAAILHLGTEEHHKRLLPGAMSVDVPGGFAMTEIGHGSDVASVATTATYDPDTEEFVINTPFRAAWKEFIGNAAVDGKAAVVFAQLVTRGINHGVHAFYVPIRDDNGDMLPGVESEDDGIKGGLNGIDNGRLAFHDVRIPRRDLLNRYGDVAADGDYSSSITSPGRRFFTMLGTLVQGRVSLDGAASVASKIGLNIAVTYGNQRRQFHGASDTDEVVLLDYQQHQRRLLPRLAETYAQHFAHDELLYLFHEVFSGEKDTDADRQDLETLAAALKPMSTWHALDTLQAAREACGGAGFMAENRIVGLRQDMDVYATFEGDNTVLLQLVAKRLLTDYGKEFTDIDAGDMARYAVGQVANTALHRTPLRRLAQVIADTGSVRRSAGHLREAQTQRELLTDRVETMVAKLAGELRMATKVSKERSAVMFNARQHELIETAKAHSELLQWEAFTAALDAMPDDDNRQVLTWVRDLFGLTVIERNLAWYMINGRMSAQRARTVTSYVDRQLVRLRPHAQDLVDAFGYGPEHIRATIATGVERERQDEARDYYRRQRASGDAPIPEKKAKKN